MGDFDLINDLDAHDHSQDTHMVDVLQEHLIRARASGGVFAHVTTDPPWGLRVAGSIPLTIHVVVRGRAWLWLEDASIDPIELSRGDFALIRGGPSHYIAHEPGANCLDSEQFLMRRAADANAPGQVALLCGAYRFDGDIGRGLVNALPPVLLLPAELRDPVHDVVALLLQEILQDAPGKQTVLDRLLDLLVVLSLRAGLTQGPSRPPWLRAASDPRLAPVLQAIYTQPGQPWTVESLAEIGAMSRATLARAFQQTLGQSPIAHLAEWRMALARDALLSTDATLAEIAATVGYTSEYAFATAFRRHHRQAPGRWRHQARQEGSQEGLEH